MPIELIQISNQNINEIIKTEQQGNITVNGYDQSDDTIKTKNLGNVIENFRDEFNDLIFANLDWTINKDNSDIITMMGDTDGSSYLSIIKNYRNNNTKTEIISKKSFSLPARLNIGISTSQRLNGVDFDIDMVSVDANNEMEIVGNIIEIGISSISITSNVWTVTCKEEILNKLFSNDIIIIHSADNSILNVGPIQITLAGRSSFTFTSTLANSSFTTAVGQLGDIATVRKLDALNRSSDGFGFSLEGGVVTGANVRYTVRNKNATYTELRNDTGLTNFSLGTSATAYNNKPYTFSIKPNRITEIMINSKSIIWNIYQDGATTQNLFTLKKHMPLPDFVKKYVLRFTVDTFKNFAFLHKADIQSISKTNLSTTVTVITKTPHNLKVGSNIITTGTTSSTNFPNLTAAVRVNTIVNETTFTYLQLTASTITATGNNGSVFLINGFQATPNLVIPNINLIFNNYQLTNNVLTITSSSNSTCSVGLYYQFFGTGADTIDNVMWKCVEISTVTTKFIPISGTVADLPLTVTNFSLVNSSEFRIHLAQAQSHKRNIVEIANVWGNSRDADDAMGVNILNTPNLGTITTVSTLTSITNAIAVNCFSALGTYTTQLAPSSNTFALSTDLGATVTRNKINVTVFSNIAISAQIEHSFDNIVWFSNDTGVTATAITYPTYNYISVASITAPTVTMTITAPGVVTHATHPFQTGAPVIFATTGALPTGVTAGTIYYIRIIDANSYHLYNTQANASSFTTTTGRINFSGTQSGTHTITNLRTLTIPNGTTLLSGTNVNVTTGGVAQVIAVTNTTVNVALESTTPSASGTVTVANNTVFRATMIALPVLGRYTRLRLTNPSTSPTTVMYASMSALQN